MNPLAEALVRNVVQLGIASGTVEGRMLAQLAANALAAEGAEPEPTAALQAPRVARRPMTNAERQAKFRAEHGPRPPSSGRAPPLRVGGEDDENVTDVTEPAVTGVTGEGGDLSEIRAGKEDREEETPARASNGNVTRRYPNSRANDGAGGWGVAAWCEAARVALGGAMTPLSYGEQRKLAAAIAAHAPKDPDEREQWARDKAAAYVADCKASGGTFSVWGFGRWADNGCQASRKPAAAGAERERPEPDRSVHRSVPSLLTEPPTGRQADEDVARRARFAKARPAAAPTPLAATRPAAPTRRVPTRDEQLAAAASFDEKPPSSRPPAKEA